MIDSGLGLGIGLDLIGIGLGSVMVSWGRIGSVRVRDRVRVSSQSSGGFFRLRFLSMPMAFVDVSFLFGFSLQNKSAKQNSMPVLQCANNI